MAGSARRSRHSVRWAALAAALVLPLAPRFAAAADVTCVALAAGPAAPPAAGSRKPTENTCIAAFLEGPIERGDYEKLFGLIRANYPFLANFYLNSPGGDAREAMRIGGLVRRLLLYVSAPFYRQENGNKEAELVAVAGETLFELCSGDRDTCSCTSSCLLIWSSGGRRNGDVFGLRQPAFRDQDFAGMSPAAAESAYRALLDKTRAFLADIQAPPALAATMMATPPSQIVWSQPGAGGDDPYPPAVSTWLAAACGTYSEAQRRSLLRDVAQAGAGKLTGAPAAARLEQEHGVIARVQQCRTQKFQDYRDSTDPERAK